MKQAITRCLKSIIFWLVQGLVGIAILGLFLLLIIEWASGCGETYTDSKGKVHINECTWKSEVPIKK